MLKKCNENKDQGNQANTQRSTIAKLNEQVGELKVTNEKLSLEKADLQEKLDKEESEQTTSSKDPDDEQDNNESEHQVEDVHALTEEHKKEMAKIKAI